MEFPLTLYFLITKIPSLMLKQDSPLVIHLVGAGKELLFIPLFAELLLLLPHRKIHIRMVGEEVVKAVASAKSTSIAKRPGNTVYTYTAPATAGL
jgi:hypothetical protein